MRGGKTFSFTPRPHFRPASPSSSSSIDRVFFSYCASSVETLHGQRRRAKADAKKPPGAKRALQKTHSHPLEQKRGLKEGRKHLESWCVSSFALSCMCQKWGFLSLFHRSPSVLLTREFSRAGDVSERETEVAEVLVAAVVHRGQVLPLLNRSGQVDRVQGELELAWNKKERLRVQIFSSAAFLQSRTANLFI